MNSRNLVWMIIVVSGLLIATNKGICERLFDRGYGIFPNLTKRGAFESWLNDGSEIEIGKGKSINLILNFSLDQRNFRSSILGDGWWFPFLESSVVKLGSGSVRLHLPGGQRMELMPDRNGQFSGPSGDWRAEVEDEKFIARRGDGWVLTYEDGRLRNAVSPTGDEFVWNFSNRRPRSVELNGRVFIELKYSNKTKLVDSIYFPSDKSKMSFNHGVIPKFARLHGREVIVESLPSISGFRHRDRQMTMVSDFVSIDDHASVQIRFAGGDPPADPRAQSSFTVDKITGRLVSDELYEYQVDLSQQNIRSYTRVKKVSGEIEKIVSDDGRGIRKRVYPGGILLGIKFSDSR